MEENHPSQQKKQFLHPNVHPCIPLLHPLNIVLGASVNAFCLYCGRQPWIKIRWLRISTLSWQPPVVRNMRRKVHVTFFLLCGPWYNSQYVGKHLDALVHWSNCKMNWKTWASYPKSALGSYQKISQSRCPSILVLLCKLNIWVAAKVECHAAEQPWRYGCSPASS